MKQIRLILLITTLFIPFASTAKKDKRKNKKSIPIEAEASPTPKKPTAEDPEPVGELLIEVAEIDSLSTQELQAATNSYILPSNDSDASIEFVIEEESVDEGGLAAEGEIPAFDLYPEWSNSRVNPYGIRLENTEDTISIDVSTFCFPLPIHYRVTSEFGFRRARFHYGIDLKLNTGDSVISAFDGMVRIAKFQKGGYGRYVVVRHNNGLETVYGHLSKILVKEGQTVKAGELLGEGGNTGRSTGPHLHFEIRYLGQAINPRDMVDFADDKLCCHNDSLSLTKVNFEYIKEVEAIKYWTVKSGHTLGHIAAKTGVSINRLCALNNIKKTSILRIGQRVRYN